MRMRLLDDALKVGAFSALLATSGGVHGQVIITASDMFNQLGQYYRAYANKNDAPVAGRLGTTGGPQVWDFVNGPKDQIYRFDYVSVTDSGHGADFGKAKVAERKTSELDGARAWLYFEQVPGLGRRTYGFYDITFSGAQPSTPFKTPILDFPETIRYKDTWATATSYTTEIFTIDTGPDPDDPEDTGGSFSIPAVFNYSSTATVDAFGIINLPGLGFGEGLRVNELVTYDVQVDLGLGDGFFTVATEYVRNYYFLMEDHGIAVQITSKQETQPPSNDFAVAASFVRLFETNHGAGDRPPDGVTGFKITLGKDKILLNWDRIGSAKAYRIEYTGDPANPGSWKTLGSQTTDNFLIDSNFLGSPTRFYRVVALSN